MPEDFENETAPSREHEGCESLEPSAVVGGNSDGRVHADTADAHPARLLRGAECLDLDLFAQPARPLPLIGAKKKNR